MNFFALLLMGVFAIPAFSLFSLALDSEAGVWGHLSSTVLPVYLGNSLILLLGVGIGTLVLGVVSGFLTTLFEFPGRCLAGMDADANQGDASLYFGNGLPGNT